MIKEEKLKNLGIDSQGNITLNGKSINAKPIGKPITVPSFERLGTYQSLISVVSQFAPQNADAFVIGKQIIENNVAVQYYKIIT